MGALRGDGGFVGTEEEGHASKPRVSLSAGHGVRQQAAQGSGRFLGLLPLKWDRLGEIPVPSQ